MTYGVSDDEREDQVAVGSMICMRLVDMILQFIIDADIGMARMTKMTVPGSMIVDLFPFRKHFALSSMRSLIYPLVSEIRSVVGAVSEIGETVQSKHGAVSQRAI